MASSAPNPIPRRRIETAIRIVSPLLDLVIAAGERVSRVIEGADPEPPPARMAPEGESAPRGLRPRRRAGRH